MAELLLSSARNFIWRVSSCLQDGRPLAIEAGQAATNTRKGINLTLYDTRYVIQALRTTAGLSRLGIGHASATMENREGQQVGLCFLQSTLLGLIMSWWLLLGSLVERS